MHTTQCSPAQTMFQYVNANARHFLLFSHQNQLIYAFVCTSAGKLMGNFNHVLTQNTVKAKPARIRRCMYKLTLDIQSVKMQTP